MGRAIILCIRRVPSPEGAPDSSDLQFPIGVMQIREASTDSEIRATGALFREYASALGIDLCFQGFAEELVSLPGCYAPPRGRLFVAWADRDPAGCAALRPLSETLCEMKRLFVKPAYRRQHLGRRLAERAICAARAIGYSSMVLDTLPSMHAALRLYEGLGFVHCAAYYDTPLSETVFLKLEL
jgi:putative acetyltransferase